VLFLANIFGYSLQNHVYQQLSAQSLTKEGSAASGAKIANRLVNPERNVVRGDVMVASLDVINEIIQTYN
jgi:hypothetical protein